MKHKIPQGIHTGELIGHLNTVTLCTTSIEEYKHFYGEVMQMDIVGPLDQSPEEIRHQNLFWNIPQDVEYEMYHFHRSSVPSLLHLRVLHLKTETPHIHNSYNSYELGSFSLGFPTAKAKEFDERMKSFNIGEMAPMQVGDIVRADGIPGQYLETIYQGPDYLHCVGIERVAISQLAPCDPDGLFCGPGYSALVSNDAEAEINFYTKVLDHYTQLDAVWKASTGSALGVAEGVPFRFTSFYAQEAKQNHIIMLEFQDGNSIDTGVPSHLPNQGLGMYSFYTSSVEDILIRATQEETEILSQATILKDPIVGTGRAVLLKAPSGMYIEIIEKL